MTDSMTEDDFKAPREVTYQDNRLSIILRPLEEKDAEVIHEAILLSLNNLRPFMDWAHRELSVEGQLQRIRTSQEGYANGTEFDFSVFDRHTGEFLMSATLGPSRTPNKKALSIGYWTSINHCGKGLATLITKILIIIAFDYMDCNRVEITCNKANEKSLNVIEKCGFAFEGQIRNYFSEPSEEMLRNGYYPDRTCLLYALIVQDLKSLSWFEEIKSKLVIKP